MKVTRLVARYGGWFGGRVHGDERGAISVLTLLMMWCFVAMLGLIWNTTEQAVYKQRVQTAADSAAHMAATLMARTVNVAAAQNMAIAQDASMETIWRAVTPTQDAVLARLMGELDAAEKMKSEDSANAIDKRIAAALTKLDVEWELIWQTDLTGQLREGNGIDRAERRELEQRLAEWTIAWDWVNNKYLPQLLKYKNSLPKAATNEKILALIIDFIRRKEMPHLEGFTQRTEGVANLAIDAEMAEREQKSYRESKSFADQLEGQVAEGGRALEEYHKVALTFATLRFDSQQHPRILAPLKPASAVQPAQKVDIIRQAYASRLPPEMSTLVTIDPISPNTWDIDPAMPAPAGHGTDNRIWYPDLRVPISDYWRAKYPKLPRTYLLHGTPGATVGWGQSWASPLERYYLARVGIDQEAIEREFWTPLDEARSVDLRTAILAMMTEAGLPNAPPMPPDWIWSPVANAQGVIWPIHLLPELPLPARSPAAWRTQVDLWNKHSAGYMAAVRELAEAVRSATSQYDRFTEKFAGEAWGAEVDTARRHVAWRLGKDKGMMVLATYDLHPIPEWAKDKIWANVKSTVEDEITRRSMEELINSMKKAGSGIAPWYADSIVRPGAAVAAEWIASEYISRPWPYEIRPPEVPVPPRWGVTRADRQKYFTVIAGARQTAERAPQLLLKSIFGEETKPVVCFAQGEAFNWMEFNEVYGGAEHFDQVMRMPWDGEGIDYSLFTPSPRPWRVGTVGGWNWRSRLSASDALAEMAEKNVGLADYLKSAGVGAFDAGAIDTVNLH